VEYLGLRTGIWKLGGLMGWVEAGICALRKRGKNAIQALFLKCSGKQRDEENNFWKRRNCV